MTILTLLGMFAVPAGQGKLEKIFKIFEFSAVPSRRTELKNYSQRNSFEPFAPAAGHPPNCDSQPTGICKHS
jgi:hypothetical protein